MKMKGDEHRTDWAGWRRNKTFYDLSTGIYWVTFITYISPFSDACLAIFLYELASFSLSLSLSLPVADNFLSSFKWKKMYLGMMMSVKEVESVAFGCRIHSWKMSRLTWSSNNIKILFFFSLSLYSYVCAGA